MDEKQRLSTNLMQENELKLVKETIVVDKLGVWHDTVSYYIFSSHGPSVSWSQIKFWKFAPEGQIPK